MDLNLIQFHDANIQKSCRNASLRENNLKKAYFCSMKKPLQLFLTFCKIGAFTLGGGYAMLSMVEKAVVDQKKWIPTDEFWDMIAVVQSLPGVFAVNTALYVGHRVAGTKGAFAAMLGAIIPSITIILLLATVFREYRDQPVVERVFKGIRPCVVALILAPSLRMIKSAKVTWKTAVIPIATVFLIWWCKVSPAYVILAAIAGSLIYALIINRRERFDKLNDREGSLSLSKGPKSRSQNRKEAEP